MPDFRLRPEVVKFAGLMEARLRKKDPSSRVGNGIPGKRLG